ncbi:hypothetical protein CEE69_03305 [Rhodopirellula bahusiensis]|uniref:Uncharacterized protein n=1 Tax=Rhodopirellula bahusiensis TaxID=2014065 RepID=A0A2G1WBM6_9BACT|nr:hypothetical protein CEE69_03305 [Rhodopirellula bahusiensis]
MTPIEKVAWRNGAATRCIMIAGNFDRRDGLLGCETVGESGGPPAGLILRKNWLGRMGGSCGKNSLAGRATQNRACDV